jgi:transposase InsO family protein
MNFDDQERREQIALFRYGVIADLIHLPRGKGSGLYDKLREKSDRDWEIPFTLRRRLATETMRDWLTAYRKGGFDTLKPKIRKDNGLTRAIPQRVADLIVETKEAHRELSVPLLLDKVAAEHDLPEGLELKPATVHRLLARHGLNRKAAGEPTSKDKRRFAFDKAGEMWMSDVMHGPRVVSEHGRKRKTYLIALIDDATRVVPYAAFAFSENTASLLPVLEQAVRRRGLPKRLYVDNGSAFRSKHLALVCAMLSITLIHARPYQPAGKGKIERFLRTVRMRLLPTLSPDDFKSLVALNRKLWGWIEGEYHHTPHRGLSGDTPLDRWATCSDEVRLADADVGELFLFEQKRKVAKDRTVSLDGVLYEVDALLVGETETLRYDPAKKGRPVQVWREGKRVQLAKPLDAYANCFVKRSSSRNLLEVSSPPDEPAEGLRLRDFRDDSDEEGA